MTEFQLNTFAKVKTLEEKIVAATDPTTFVLNADLMALNQELDKVRAECHHEFVKGYCVVCGAKEQA